MTEISVQSANNLDEVEALTSDQSVKIVKELLMDTYKCTFKITDKRNQFFNDLELNSRGEFVYKRVFMSKEDLYFENNLIKEIIEILSGQKVMQLEQEAIYNVKFQKTWTFQNKTALKLSKKKNIFEVSISRNFL